DPHRRPRDELRPGGRQPRRGRCLSDDRDGPGLQGPEDHGGRGGRAGLHPPREGVPPRARPDALPPAHRGAGGDPPGHAEDPPAGRRRRQGLRPLAAPAVRWQEKPMTAPGRTLALVVGSHPSAALVSVEGHASEFEQIMGQIVAEAGQHAIADYGIDLVDIRLRQLSLPEQNRANVFARMQAERGKIAMKYRSEGEREFKKVVAEAEREKTRILAEAYREAERAKGAGDAEAMRIYAEAFGKNPQLYKF